MKSERFYNIDLLKVLAIIIIIVSHVIPFNYYNYGSEYIDIRNATCNFDELVIQFFRIIGQIGNIIFVIASAFFLVDKKKIKFKKILLIIFDCFIISNVVLILFLSLGYNLSFKDVIKNIFPITFGTNWFIAVYLIFYLISPLLNKIK